MSYKVKAVGRNPDYQVLLVKVFSERAGRDHFPSSLFLQSKTRSFRKLIKYRVTVVQEVGTEDIRFRLWTGYDYSQAKEAFDRIQATLDSLLNKGTVFVSKHLLKEVITPVPMDPKEITSHLIDVMQLRPDSHPEWFDVIQALLNTAKPPALDAASRREYLANLKAKYSSGQERHDVTAGANISLNVPLIAVPHASDSVEDKEESDRVWKLFKQGKLKDQPKLLTDTWLIDAIKKQHHKSTMNLILSRVNTNDQCLSTGDTPLHIAVRNGDLMLVKLLLAYEADPTIPNKEDETPLDAAHKLTCKNANEIVLVLEKMKELWSKASSYYSKNTELPEKRNSSDIFLLGLDGGGMRAVIMCHVLAAVNERMNALSSSCEPLHSYFDYIAGTSSGAVVAAFLLYKSTVSVSNAGMYLYKFMNEVFRSDKTERSDKFKEFVTDAFGEATVMSDLPKGKNIIVTATIANTSPNKLHLMTNYGEKRDGLSGPDERKVWEAVIASSAAPTYFPSFECFLDGGLMANNPTLAAMAEIFDRKKIEDNTGKLGFVLSLGTGFLHPPKEVSNFEVYVPGFSLNIVEKLVGSSLGLVSLLNHFIEEATQSNGEVVHQASAWCESIGATYMRLSPPLEEDVAPDMNSAEELVDLLFETEQYILQEHINIDRIAKIILSK